MDKQLMATLHNEVYRSGQVLHITGFNVGVDQDDNGQWFANAYRDFESTALHERFPQYPKDQPFTLHLSCTKPFDFADLAIADIWEWLGKNGARIAKEASSGTITACEDYAAAIPISSQVTTVRTL